MDYRGIIEIPSSYGLEFVQNIFYPFVITASAKQADFLTTTQTIYVRWEPLTVPS